jgi:hypothetical protein
LIVKPKKCSECGGEFRPFRTTQSVCSTACAIKDAATKAKKKEAKEWKVEKARRVDKMKTRTQKINEVRPVFQRWIRHRDKDQPCISCPATFADEWHGGHYFKAELYTGIIFNELNCNKQCKRCNKFGQGMQAEYRIGLVKRIGEAAVLELESIKDALRVYKWSDDELSEIKKKYTAKLKE